MIMGRGWEKLPRCYQLQLGQCWDENRSELLIEIIPRPPPLSTVTGWIFGGTRKLLIKNILSSLSFLCSSLNISIILSIVIPDLTAENDLGSSR